MTLNVHHMQAQQKKKIELKLANKPHLHLSKRYFLKKGFIH